MLKVIGWVRPNGNMNLTKYMDYLSQAGLDEKTLGLTKVILRISMAIHKLTENIIL